jgi:hypothetical protein
MGVTTTTTAVGEKHGEKRNRAVASLAAPPSPMSRSRIAMAVGSGARLGHL